MNIMIPVNLKVSEGKIREIAQKVIERRTAKIIKEQWKRNQDKYKREIEWIISDFVAKHAQLLLRNKQK